ncbi:hypothetical protein C9374_000854 [Naegleria lovaniensis]|uniref:Intraflagellar transport protein 46 homolog n=1 Tax=Naegleria lovaniensis TaxID=51637 RepID=A0AA88GXM8_NAELO|nr:uncharacterized protein C9374_000854 [Naegleria lovaniensis]KAG2388004.1 hypothetical protein C9374_000854 [Naegleria lovaniensis]
MMNTSMEGGSDDGESTEYETDEEEETINDQGMSRSLVNRRHEDDDFGLPSDDEEGEDDEESDNLNSTGKFTSIGNSSSSNNIGNKGIVVSNRYERGNSGSNRPTPTTTNQKPSSAQGKVVPNQHYDEVFETNDDEVHSIPSPEHTPRDPRMQVGAPNTIPSSGIAVTTKSEVPNNRMQHESEEEEEDEEEEEEEEEEVEDDEEEEEHYSASINNTKQQQQRSQHASYNANESNVLLSKMNVSNELKELFTYINRYKPHEIELDTKLKPFIPDYMASVGELDPFLKVKRPDLKEDELDDLGLKVIDEPNPVQSDPTVVTLDLTYQMKGDMSTTNIASSTAHSESVLSSGISMKKPETIIKSVESGNDKLILKWINDIRELHKKKPPPTVQYSKVNVDFTQLIQAWPDAFEEELAKTDLPGADLDVDLDEYIKIVCSILDVPVYEGHLIESLHVLFTLYLEFKTNQHIQSQMM